MGSKNELGNFLKACRARRKPEDLGIPVGTGVRRTPGLRREEISATAGISMDYYTRLEQGRERHPSDAVLDALARVLRLDEAEHQHLHNLARHAARPPRGTPEPEREVVRPTVQRLLTSLGGCPAYVLNQSNDVLAANPSGWALLPGIEQWEPERRNSLRYVFLHPSARTLYVRWHDIAQDSVAHLRSTFGDNPCDPRVTGLIDELTRRSEEFHAMWQRNEVQPKSAGVKSFNHPSVGRMDLGYEVLAVSGTQQRLIVYQAPEGSPDEDAMRLLRHVAPAQRVDVG
ncbi:helix-turn-helix transcriptional regulator [Saccharopolyspora taberi]|uniref:Helix-turn-helix transcriptional regulator n=1 Tax=Saccharopolyspora taberi TaxID=60895 RepID=A0ABN3VNG6_9PSEU